MSEIRMPTIWELGAAPQTAPPAAGRRDKAPEPAKPAPPPKLVAVCPQCGQREPAVNGSLPMLCRQCSYFFQTGIDRLVADQPLKQAPPAAAAPASPAAAPARPASGRRSPMPSAGNDRSRLRLLWVSRPDLPPVTVPDRPTAIGAKGTLLPQLVTDAQATLRHSPAGWYIMVTHGEIMCNGSLANRGMQIRLHDGDQLEIGDDMLQAEIIG